MKFQKPIAEITRFDLRDVISVSETEDHVQADTDFEGQCTYTKTDLYMDAPCA